MSQFVRTLAQFPSMGQEATDLPLRSERRFVLGDDHILDDVGPDGIRILPIRHGRERPPDLPLDDETDFETP
ncbi:type II toxin-antitoxin system RelE/ParE family toxin [Rhizobium sp. G187]|uniref:type II toxin-antitoxin system RelE/ParE family toxin n=1 Tax=Rhizobium sp. G187 TaxID=3451352 RepID=UPI003EE485E8